MLGKLIERHEEMSTNDGFFEYFKHKVFLLDLAVFPRNIFDDIGYHTIIIASFDNFESLSIKYITNYGPKLFQLGA